MEDGSDDESRQVGGDKQPGEHTGGVPGGDVPATAGGGQGGGGDGSRPTERRDDGGGASAPEAGEGVDAAGKEVKDIVREVPPAGVSAGPVPAVSTTSAGEKVDGKENLDNIGPGTNNLPRGLARGIPGHSETGKSSVSTEAEKTTGDKEVHSAEDDGGLNKIGKNHFAAVYIPATEEEKARGIVSGVVRFTEQEAAVLTAFMRSADYEKTALEVQTNKDGPIKVDSVKRILRRPNLKRYILFQIRVHTVKEIDPDWAKAEVLPVWAGDKKVTDDQKWAMNSIIKLVTPKGGGVQVNVQQNSIYGGMSPGAVDAEWVDAKAASAEGV